MSLKKRLAIAGARRLLSGLALAAAIAPLASCGGGSGSSNGTPPPPSALKITTSTTFFPTFDPAVTDYVVTPPSGALQVNINAPTGTTVSVDGKAAKVLSFTTPVTISPGQSFAFTVNATGASTTYHVRCLPGDFPAWNTERPGAPQAEFYAFTPNISLTGAAARKYLILADGYGVPIWWYKNTDAPSNATVLSNGDLAWTLPAAVEEHKLDGTLVRSFNASGGSTGIMLDIHELQQLSNGNFLIIGDVFRGPVDVTAIGGGPAAPVYDTQIEEVTPSGAIVWNWSPLDHIPVTEMDQAWWSQYITNSGEADPYHLNSVEPDGSGLILSFRHEDAVYKIDKTTGNVVWKLGGTPRAESLTFKGDPYGNFSGQHDARLLPDGTLTLHDNGTNLSRPPRAVRYSIDTAAKTATFVEQVVDPDVSSSECCGSARKVSGGDWVMSWGFQQGITEMTPASKRVFRLTFKDPYFSYRVLPIEPGVFTRAALRTGMDAQFPRAASN